jgi:hypothetical protein
VLTLESWTNGQLDAWFANERAGSTLIAKKIVTITEGEFN